MVRFKLLNILQDKLNLMVTIPLWFDSNTGKEKRSYRVDCVTIPLWFDSNEIFGVDKIEDPAVTIPLWFDSNGRRRD